jgi:hypothetical protein
MTDHKPTNVMVVVEHKGRTYRKGPWHVHVTTSEARELDEITYILRRFMVEIKREIEHFEKHGSHDRANQVQKDAPTGEATSRNDAG